MSICRQWSLVKQEPGRRHARLLYCRSWSCPECAPKRRSQLLAKCACGLPTRLITLTVSANAGTSPEDRLRNLARAWRICVQRIRRRYPSSPIDYLAIVETTKRGEPHLHILVRGPYIPQRWLSSVMEEIIASPIVDIRRIHNARHAILYVAKYVTKDPQRLGTSKRYWSSRTWEVDTSNAPPKPAANEAPWVISKHTLGLIILQWMHQGWHFAQEQDGTLTYEYRDPPGAARWPESGTGAPR